jgi:hypothetical protein
VEEEDKEEEIQRRSSVFLSDLPTSANTWFLTPRPAHVTVSCDRNPERAPLPYWMAKLVPLAKAIHILRATSWDAI